MPRGLSSWLKKAGRRPSGEEDGGVFREVLEACRFEKEWLERGFTLEDLSYYTMPFHEDEACERIGSGELCEEFLEGAREWYKVVFSSGAESTCTLLEKLGNRGRAPANQ